MNSIGLFSGNHDVYYRKSTRFVKNFLRCDLTEGKRGKWMAVVLNDWSLVKRKKGKNLRRERTEAEFNGSKGATR